MDESEYEKKPASVIKMPDPPSRTQHQQAILKSLGISEELCQVLDIQDDPKTGETYVIVKLSPEMARASDKLASSVRLHDPEHSSSFPTIEADGEKIKAINLGDVPLEKAKKWVKSERRRRGKPQKSESEII